MVNHNNAEFTNLKEMFKYSKIYSIPNLFLYKLSFQNILNVTGMALDSYIRHTDKAPFVNSSRDVEAIDRMRQIKEMTWTIS